MNGGDRAERAYSGSGSYSRREAPPVRSFEERAQAKEQMMASVRESSQQERRVYVGNLSYDVKWHHLKDFMRQGTRCAKSIRARSYQWLKNGLQRERFSSPMCYYFRMECRRWAPMCRWLVFLVVLWMERWIDGWGHCSAGHVGMRVRNSNSRRSVLLTDMATVLLSTQQGIKPNRPSARSATKI